LVLKRPVYDGTILIIEKNDYMKTQIQPASGKLGILLPGLGAVGTTVIAGVMAVNKGISQPIGALTQMGNIRLGKRLCSPGTIVRCGFRRMGCI
jgi:hypothetical protein